ncbi:hypothetical protein KIL84_008510 [Mauremys mutica]|uniref:Uncharacterized protein n=1 Tax=Mauremys mutica TaxID=74926 RepID=A0A9D3X307_9SAUR|nr:hypothetical protein KIL84_008510 [Mauremys mutica]
MPSKLCCRWGQFSYEQGVDGRTGTRWFESGHGNSKDLFTQGVSTRRAQPCIQGEQQQQQLESWIVVKRARSAGERQLVTLTPVGSLAEQLGSMGLEELPDI